MTTPVVTRFAPSPTGMLHIGGVRTALFSWLYARRMQGQFILRVEDTDLERSTPEAVKVIVEGMAWLGLEHDQGPFYQTQRLDRYKEVIAEMIKAGTAYHCYCSKEELDAMRADQQARKEKPRYDGRCRHGKGPGPASGRSPVVRFKNPEEGATIVEDVVHGAVTFQNKELDDLIIARSDGTPTYNFCVVVDDVDMRITHVIRGDDHVNNTPRQINIMRALGATVPIYAHLPTVLTPGGERLSKRHGARGVLQYRDEGYVPEAIVNYLARLGWAHGDAEVFGVDEFVAWFNLQGLTPSPARFDPEKLQWLNHEHLKRLDDAELGRRLAPFLAAAGIATTSGPGVERVAALLRDRAATLTAMAEAARYFYEEPALDAAMLAGQINDANRTALVDLQDELASVPWERAALGAAIKAVASRHGLKPAQLMMPLRAVVAGTLKTPAIDAVLELVGRDATRVRLAQGLRLAGTSL